jgi:hypothetical protein
MQDQPHDSPKRSDVKRARQAARATDDVFKGGDTQGAVRGRLKSPWNVGPGRLWEAARRREISSTDD